MAAEALKEAPSWFLIIVILTLIWIYRDLKSDVKKDKDEQAKQSAFSLQQNTIALIELKSEVKNLNQNLMSMNTRMDNMEQDVDALHAWRREVGKTN